MRSLLTVMGCLVLLTVVLRPVRAQLSDNDIFAAFCLGVINEGAESIRKSNGADPHPLEEAMRAFQRYQDYLMIRGYSSGLLGPNATAGVRLARRHGADAARICYADAHKCVETGEGCAANMHVPSCDQVDKCWMPNSLPF